MPVPAAEDLVGRWRADWDPSAASGVPAHITILYPFVPPEELDAEALATLTELFSGHEPFDYELAEVRRFEPRVVYLAPEPDGPFRALTASVTSRWPHHPPYGGEFDEVIPHLTVIDVADPIRAAALAAEVAVGTEMALPLRARCDHVALLAERDGWWEEEARFGLGG